MIEEYAIFRDYKKALDYVNQQRYLNAYLPIITIKQVEIEPENLDHDFTAREEFTENPETVAQLHHLEKYGYFYK